MGGNVEKYYEEKWKDEQRELKNKQQMGDGNTEANVGNADCPLCNYLDGDWRLDQMIHPVKNIGVRNKYVTRESNDTIVAILIRDDKNWENTEV